MLFFAHFMMMILMINRISHILRISNVNLKMFAVAISRPIYFILRAAVARVREHTLRGYAFFYSHITYCII